jgi:3-(3-hydroxy-phenyl)propionate hydroxylase
MPEPFIRPHFPFVRPPEMEGHSGQRPVVIVGAGPVGLALAIDLAQRSVPVVLLDEDSTVSYGSRLICMAKRSLEILDRLGIGAPLAETGVLWNRGRVFRGASELYNFDLLPEPGHQWPAFMNIQQYRLEAFLVARAAQLPAIDLRWQSRVAGLELLDDGVRVTVETPEGSYGLMADWLLACDGARSMVRRSLALPFIGQAFTEQFLIADVVMRAGFPAERWFWFEPPFHDGGSALLHKQPDDVWRIDLQLGRDADPVKEAKPERVVPRIRAMLGPDAAFELEWVSVYTFRCRRLDRFRKGRVLFLGDAAHQVSPFGARGGNGGLQDADNLGWKLAAVLLGSAPERLIDSYETERIPAADENILNSTRSAAFIAPPDAASRRWRDAVLDLAADHPFARRLVNSGRLSVPAVLAGSPLSTDDTEPWAGGVPPGTAAIDAPLGGSWLLPRLWDGFTTLRFDADLPCDGVAATRYDARPGTTYLFRPDGHVAARWRDPSPTKIDAAKRRACGW